MSRDRSKKSKSFFENGSWYHRVKILQEDGTTKYTKRGGFQSQSEAEESYVKYEEAFKEAFRIFQLTHQINSEITLKDYLIYWFEQVFSARVESTSKMVVAYVIYDLLLPQIDYEIKLKFVNTEYLNALFERCSKATKSAGNKSREVMNLALKEAVVAGYIQTNPVPSTKPYKRSKPKITILGKEKVKVLLKAAAGSNWYLEILLALFCGLRKGEIAGLKFSDFDYEKDTVHVTRQLVKDPKIQKGTNKIEACDLIERLPKTENSIRTLRVPKIVIREVKKRRLKVQYDKTMLGDRYCDSGYISCQENGEPHSMSAMNIALNKLCSRNSLPHVTVHGLRHMYATILYEQGVSLVKISALLGHASIHTTFEYYVEVMDENENILAFMNKAFVPVA